MPSFFGLAFWQGTPWMEPLPVLQMEQSRGWLGFGSALNWTGCLRRSLVGTPPGSERSSPAKPTRWSRYRTAGWQRPESCGSRGPIPIYRPYYAAGWTTAIESSDYQWIQLVTTIRSCLIRGIVQMRLWQGSCGRYMEAEYSAVHFAGFKIH